MYGGNFGGNMPGHGHHGHGHHGHHNNHHNNSNQGFVNQNQWGQQTGWAPVQGAQYKIISGLSSKMVLDVSQNQHEYNHLILYEWHNSSNQKFYFQSIGGNKYGIFSSHNNQTVEIPNGNQNSGTRVVCGQPNMQVNEFWELIPASFMGKPNAFYIKSFNGKTIDVHGAECKNGAHIIQWDYNGNENQIWVIEQV